MALSGGADSMCALVSLVRLRNGRSYSQVLLYVLPPHFLSTYCSECLENFDLRAYTVDHALREESARESNQCKTWCESLGVPHRTLLLQWEGKEFPARLKQLEYRRRRYDSLSDACLRDGVNTIVTGHQFEDQIETFLLRLGRASGIHGLISMQMAIQLQNGIHVFRPFLSIQRSRMEATCKQLGWSEWIEDPTNVSMKYDRNRVRSAMTNQLWHKKLSAGDPSIIGEVIGMLQTLSCANVARQAKVTDFLNESILNSIDHQYGFVRLKLSSVHKWLSKDGDYFAAAKGFASLIRQIGGKCIGGKHEPPMKSLHKLLRFISQHVVLESERGVGQPLGGVLCHIDGFVDEKTEKYLILCCEKSQERENSSTSRNYIQGIREGGNFFLTYAVIIFLTA